MDLTFLHPHAAWLLLLLPVFWWWARGRATRTHRALRTAIFACLIAALTQPSLIHRASATTQVIVIDQSERLSPAARAQAQAALTRLIAQASRGQKVAVVQMGGAPVTVKADRLVRLDGAQANSLSAALGQALEIAPLDGAGVVSVISDGLSADRHWDRAVDGLMRRGVVVNTIALTPPTRDAFISGVTPDPARAGEAMTVRVDVEGQGRDLTVSLYGGDRLLGTSPVFQTDGVTRLGLAVPGQPAGFSPLRAVLSKGGVVDGSGGEVTTIAAVQDPLRVLYLGQRQQGGAAQLQRLVGSGFVIDNRAVETLGDAFDFSAYRAVVLDDVPAARLAPGVQRGMMAAVANRGTGLFYSGGEAAFAPGGYDRSPLAASLPIEIKQEQRTEDPSVALAVVIDTSGSMAGQPLELAKQIARLTVRRLTASDSVGVVEFYGGRQWVAPMQPARNIPELERAIGRVQAQGSTVLYPALEEAYYGLKNTDARYKHILVISDAGVAEGRYQQLIRHIAQDRISLSTVLVGDDPEGEERMSQWARLGRGRYYAAPDEFSLVELNFKQQQQKPEPGYKRGAFPVSLRSAQPWWRDMTIGAIPPLNGYSPVDERRQAETWLRTASGDPVLASWQYGAGRVTALMTEPVGEGAAGWRGWRDYGRWLGRVIGRTADQQPAYALDVKRRFDRLTITAQAMSPGAATPEIRFVDQDGRDVGDRLTPEEKAPGLFVVETAFDPNRDALVEVRAGGAVQRAANAAGSDITAPDRLSQLNALPLAQLSRLTNGFHAEDPSGIPGDAARATGRGDFVATDLWSWLSILAICLYLIELAYRRWPTRRRAM